jgi:hypothetical protein
MIEHEPRWNCFGAVYSMHAPPALMSTTLQPIAGFFRSTKIDPALAGPLGRTRWYLLCSRIGVDRDKRCPCETIAAKPGACAAAGRFGD